MQLLTRSNAPSIVLRGLVLCGLTLAQLAGPAPAAWAAPTPSTTITPPANAMIGEPIAFTVSFANTGGVGEVGYGPYLNVELPMEGADGAGVAIDDGVSFTSASYLGSPLTPLMAPFLCSGTYTHPLTGLSTACTVGTQVVVLQLPFGSFAVGQPGADVLITAALSNLADVSTPLTLRATGGFAYGSIPTGNTPIIGSTATATVTPQLFTLTKTYIGPEDETATGPNYPRQYRITVDIADGQTLTNLNLTDVLTDSLQYLSTDAVTTAIGSPTVTAVITPSLVLPGGTLTRRLSAATGTAGADDASMLFSYYVPLLRATGTDVLDPATGDDRLAPDDASASGTWTPIDGRDAAGPVSSNVTVNDHILEEQAIAIQKGVAVVIDNAPTGYSPDDVVEYTLDVQISDFFVFNSTVITDTFSDGQRWDTSFTPTLSVAGNGFTSASAGFDPANVTVDISQIGDDVNPATDGSTTVHFRLSDELIARGEDGRFVGGCVPTTGTGGPAPDCAGFNDGATTAQIRFRAVVQQDFSDTYPSGDPSVDQGDVLTNTVTIDGAVLAVADATTPTGFSEADDSAAQFELAKGVLEKTIYALNGVVCPVCNSVIIEPGDTVTYRFTYTLPQTDFENLEFTDYLPLPVFDATTITVFTTTVSAGAPPSGMAKYGPSDTAFAVTGITPVITTTASSNTVAFGFGSYDDPGDSSTTVDVLFTVTVSDDPFVDGLFLTNQVRASEGTTNAGSQVDDSIVMIELGQPELAILKGVVATNGTGGVFAPATVGPVSFVAPGTAGLPWSGGPISSAALAATPINSNLSGIDAGDLVSFAITLENAGGADAFDVVVTDTLPSGFVVPPAGAGLNLRVYDGAGTAVAYTSLSGGLFGDGIRLNDPSATVGGLPAGRDTGGPIATGANVVMVVYDLQLADTIAPNSAQINTGQIASFAGAEAGPSHPTTGLSDTATVTSRNVGPAKTIVATSEAHTSGNSLAIGEIARYRLAVSLPEGLSTNFQLVDTVPPGLTVLNDGTINVAFVCNGGGGCISSSTLGTTPVLSGNSAITPTATLAAGAISPAVLSTGTDVTYSLGDLTNTDRDSDTEYVVVEFNALLDNTSAGSNDAGETRTNSVAVRVGGSQLATANAPAITIVEPLLTLAKTANPTTLDNGDTVTYTVVITNATGASRSIAYDLVITDVVPSELTLNPASLSITSGSVSSSGNALTATVSSLATGGGVTLTYAARLDNLTFGVPITNTAAVAYTSLPGAGTIGNPTGSNTPGASGSDTGERDGSGGAVNDYRTTDPASITAPSSLTKTIVETSESSTSGGNGAIGEIVRYRVVGLLPESTVPALQLLDNLPAGLTYLNDGTATLAFVCNSGPSCASSTTLGSAPVLSGSAPITPTYALPGGAITGGPFTNGVDPTFSAGTVTNVDDDADLEYIVLEFNVIVANIAGNTNGTNRDNTATAIVNGVASGTSPSVRVTVVRPAVSLAKSVIAPAPADAGDTLTYRLNYTNTAATASAFDLVVTDTIPALVTGPFTITSSTTSGACGITTPTFGNVQAGQAITSTLSCLAPGASAVVTITGQIAATAPVSSTIVNTGYVQSSTLPGTNGTTGNATGSDTPGAPGAADGEAVSNTSANVTVNLTRPSLDKVQPAPASYTIGDVITYTVVITTPEGITPNLVVTDTLPTGLSYVSSQVVTSAAASGGRLAADYAGTVSAAPTVTTPAGAIRFVFGDTQATADNDTTNNRFLLQIVTRVDNVLSNQNGVTRVNTANLSYGDGTPPGTTTVNDPIGGTITVVEPILALTKAITGAPSPADGAGTVTYRLVFNHAGGSAVTAYDTVLSDTIPSALVNASVTGVTASGVAAPSAGIAGGVLTVPDTGTLDLPVGAVVTVTVQADLIDTVAPGEVVTNTAALTWTTQPGVDANERGSGNGLLGGGGLNDYEVRAGATTTIDGPAVVKRLTATSALNTSGTNVTIGEIISYAIDVALPEGVTPSLVVTDALPSGLIFVPASEGFDASGFAGTIAAPAVSGGAADGDDIVFTFTGPITTTADNDPNNDTVTLSFDARVTDSVPNQNTQTRVNGASVNAGGVVMATNTVTATIVEPDLGVDIVVDDASPAFGQTLTYTLNVSHTVASTSPAEDVVITVTVPAGLTYVNGSVTTPPGWAVDTSTPGVLVFTISEWTSGSIAPTFQSVVGVSPTVSIGDVLTVPVAVSWTSLPGSDAGERTGAGGVDDYLRNDSVPVTVSGIDLVITKSDADVTGTPGGTVTYTLTITNAGNTTATGVVVTDTVPTDTSFVSASNGGTESGGLVTWNVASLAAGATFNRTLIVRVDSPLAFGTTSITNTAFVTDDGATGPDLNPPDNSDTEPTPIGGLVVDLQLTKDDGVITAAPGQTLIYTLVVRNVGTTTATGVVLTDTVPAHTTFVGASDSGTESAGVVTWPAVTLIGGGGSITRTLTVQVDNPLAAGVTTIDNTATVTDDGASGPDPSPSDNTATDSDTIDAAPDVAVVKDDGLLVIASGQTYTYTLTIQNVGDIGVTGVLVTDTLPAEVSFVAASDSGTESAGVVTWPAFNLAAGASVSRTVSVLADDPLAEGTVITNTVVVTDDGTNGSDVNPGNNSDDDVDTVDNLVDLQIDKIQPSGVLILGDPITYTLAYTNAGNVQATGVVITETVPTYTVFVATGSTAGWSCADGSTEGTVCTLNVGTLAVGANGSATFIVVTTPSLPLGGLVTNTALIGDDGTRGSDPTPSNNTSTVGGIPTAVELLYFVAERGTGGLVQLRWAVGQQIDTIGYRVLRAAEDTPDLMVEVAFVPAKFESGDLAYTAEDAPGEGRWVYWLVEVDTAGVETRYPQGAALEIPADVTTHHIYLPMITMQ